MGNLGSRTPDLPSEFSSWEQARNYYAFEAVFLKQLADRHPTKGNRARHAKAVRLAVQANERCEEPER